MKEVGIKEGVLLFAVCIIVTMDASGVLTELHDSAIHEIHLW